MKYLTFALTKGRLANQTMELLNKIGITCEEMQDPNSRKLIFVNEDAKEVISNPNMGVLNRGGLAKEPIGFRFFLAKGADVPTYVEYGAADIGVVGKDVILEEGRKANEVLDLKFGACKMCICGFKNAKELLVRREPITVATKYPNIAKDYFYNQKHQTVEIIKMNGSIELAPIVGLSQVIVDIVETGSTLKENGLVVLEEMMPLSARMIVNTATMRMETEQIQSLVTGLREVLH
jgi:ATP phosphoribosyltransferase